MSLLNCRPLFAALVFGAVIAAPSLSFAQRQAGTSAGGTQGTGGLGAGTLTNAANASNVGGGAANGGTQSVQSVQGRQAGSQAGSQTGQGMTRPDLGAFGERQDQIRNGSGFIGRGQSDTFVGQQFPGQQNGGQQFGRSTFLGPQFGSQFGGAGAIPGATGRGTGQPTTRSRAERLRPQHRVAFSFVPVSAAAVSSRLQTQIRPLRTQGRIRGVQFSLADDGTLTLRGTAASNDDRELAAAVARLEPGVRRIDNQIVVPSAAGAPNATPVNSR